MDVEGITALVPGEGSGLGEATARRLAGLGARVAIVDFDGARAEAVAAEIGGIAIRADVGNAEAVSSGFDQAASALGEAPRAIVSCAGIGTAARILPRDGTLPFDLFERTIRVDPTGSYVVMSLAAKRMAALEPLADGERGVIVNTSSVAFQDGQRGQAAYAASKGGVASMCLPAARELAQTGIRVMVIAPGLFQTPIEEGLPEEVSAKITANIPFPARLGAPEEFAMLAEQIISNPFLNGTTIRLDGATRLPPR